MNEVELNDTVLAQREGRWEEAEARYRQALEGGGEADPAVLNNLGQILRQRGQHDEAIECYRRATAQPDAPGATWFNLGNAQFEAGKWADAQGSLQRALELDPSLEAAALLLARCAVQQGQWRHARECFAEVLKGNPNNFSAWLECGHLCRRLGVPAQALICYRKAVDTAPGRWVGHAYLARAHEEAGEWDPATVHGYRALLCDDSDRGLQPLRVLGRARVERGDAHGAAQLFAHALSIAPEDHELMIDMADVLMRAGDTDSALALFEKAGQSRDADVLTQLATVLFRYNFWEQAEAVLRAMVSQSPDDWTAHFKLGKLLIESWRMEEGLACLDEAERLAPAMPAEGKALRASAAAKIGDADGSLGLFRQLGEAEGPQSPLLSSAAMASLYSDTLAPEEVARLHRELFAPLGEGARTRFERDRTPTRRLRIGYVTADMHHQHPVNIFMQPILERHDAAEVDVTVYFVGITLDDQSRLAKSRVDRWREVQALDDVKLARMIDEDEIDILVDLIGHTSYNRRQLFARRAAPVQACFLGYPCSTGLPNMDWILADPEVAPEEEESLYSERVARLPHCVFCYAPTVDYPFPEFAPERAERPLVLGSFNNISKLTPKTIALWGKVLEAVPDARLVLKAPSFLDTGAVARFSQLFRDVGVTPDRLSFRGPTGLSEMMSEYGEIDIALDTAPYTGGTTTYQALWMGAPVVTLRGHGFCQRMGSSIVKAIGHPEWIADDEAQYVDVVRRLAADRAGLLDAKRTLRERMQASPALDIDRYVRDMEGIYRKLWTDWCAQADADEGDAASGGDPQSATPARRNRAKRGN
ncbi:MAG: tetratricopeptide repeat protein [Rhodocyclaceae bacterium]